MPHHDELIDLQSDTLLRYIHEESKLRGDGTVKPEALMPVFDSERARWETSTYRRTRFSDQWQAGTEYLAGLRPIKAVAYFTGESVYESELDLDPDDDPPGHVSIIGWPDDTHGESRKDQRKARAQRLARQTRFERRTES